MQAVANRLQNRFLLLPGVGAIALAMGLLVSRADSLRLAILLGISFVFLGIGFTYPQHLMPVFLVWMTLLGLVRRLVGGSVGGLGDPLLLVGPVGLIVLVLARSRPMASPPMTRLTYCVLALQGLSLLSMFNPLQGGLLVGLAGLMFLPVPMLAFWAGRSLCDDQRLTQILRALAILALPAALYGLFQILYGFPSWDSEWISRAGYTALTVRGVTRPFSSFSSASDYTTFIAIAVVAWTAFVRRPLALRIFGAGLLFTALLYGAQRTTMVTLLGATALVLAARRKLPLAGAFIVGLGMLVALPFVLTYLAPSLESVQAQSPLIEHQIQGLANPVENSTLGIHASMIRAGFESLKSHPLGLGIGAISIASQRFGGVVFGTEFDPSNASVALGVPGLVIFLALFVIAFRTAYGRAAERRDILSNAALAILAVTAFNWLNGGQYAVAWIPWLILGWLDRSALETEELISSSDGLPVHPPG